MQRPNSPATLKAPLKKIRTVLVFALPPVLFFGYYPVITLAPSDSMNLELSLPLIWLLIFALLSLPTFFRLLISSLKAKKPLLPLLTLAPLYATLSILWSPNPLRALLTAGVFWCILISATSIFALIKTLKTPQKLLLLKIFFISAALFCLWCWLQCILDVAGVSRDYTLLCLGCTYQSFGFPHPNGLAIEPQFMGNLLLAPTLLSLYFLAKYRATKNTSLPLNPTVLKLLAALFLVTLFLTFSRGAIYAFAVALLALIVVSLKFHFFNFRLILAPVIAFLITLTCQGALAALSPAHLNFWTAEARAIHHLSLGIIDLRPVEVSENVATTPTSISETSSTTITETSLAVTSATSATAFTGYVPESTNIRLELNELALNTWTASPTNFLFGTGLGSAGTVLAASYPDEITTKKEIVQNEYLSVLLELGLIGALIILVALIALLIALYKRAPNTFFALLPLLLAYAITLLFFSGFPSALQIYLLPPLLAALSSEFAKTPNSKSLTGKNLSKKSKK